MLYEEDFPEGPCGPRASVTETREGLRPRLISRTEEIALRNAVASTRVGSTDLDLSGAAWNAKIDDIVDYYLGVLGMSVKETVVLENWDSDTEEG